MRIPIETTDPYKVQKSLYINLLNAASMLEHKLSEALANAPRGLYRMGDIDPIFRSGVPYFTIRRTPHLGMEFDQIHDMNEVNQAVYDADGKTLVSAEFMKQKKIMLSPGPTIPARALKLIEALLDYAIHSTLLWTPRYRSTNRILDCFLPEYRAIVDVEELLKELRYVWAPVMDFMGDDLWCYYTIHLHNADIYINKCQDYRVIQWELAQQPVVPDHH